ncbi:radical SAM protein [Bilifractor sp. LCP21S3_A7]|uniref:radical SAM protein n=1 Tax=Bilifractor sp. LCP21S3_A7 TaxID=3438738 RepID=UPI003F91D5A8
MKSPQDMRIIQIDITNACLYQCSNCTRFCGHHKTPFFMDFDTFKRAVDSLEGYHGTIGIMGGEPTIHPEFEKFAEYLNSKMTGPYAKKYKSLIKPQKDFIESIYLENKQETEVYKYHTGDRETNVGAGLWTAMVPTYKKYYELIQDVFKIQAVNDHGNVMYHSPILINRRDLNIPDSEWYELRNNCWAQNVWSATITPKGAFFCEVAGALDMLFNGPGGWPIEPGWWKRTPDSFGVQLEMCEYCGLCLDTFTRNANDWVDDVSDTMYKKLQEIDSPKLRNHPERINRVKIVNGKIAKESENGALGIRHEMFYDDFMSRFNRKRSILYPENFEVVIDIYKETDLAKLSGWIDKFAGDFKDVFVLCDNGMEKQVAVNTKLHDNVNAITRKHCWGDAFAHALQKSKTLCPIIYLSGPICLKKDTVERLDELIFNPGTLMMTDLGMEESDLVNSDEHEGIAALFLKEARSIRSLGYD